jgi:hypothetical protein
LSGERVERRLAAILAGDVCPVSSPSLLDTADEVIE